MGKIIKIIFISLLFVQLVFAAGCKKNNKQVVDNIAKKQESQSIDIFGKIITTNITNVNIDFPAKIEKIHVKEGQKIKLGDPLVSLSIKDFESQIKTKELELESAKFDLKSEQLELKKNQENLKPAESDLEKAMFDYESKKKMFNDGLISKKDVDGAETVLNTKKQAYNDIRIILEKLNAADNVIEIKKNRVVNIENELAHLKDKINITNFRQNTIISDIKNGIVYEISYSNGDIIIPSQNYKKILGIMDLDSMIVQADVPEEFIKDIQIGNKVIISPTADLDRKYDGKIARISSMAVKKNNETIISIDISIDKIDDFLRPNFNVDVKVLLNPDDSKKETSGIKK